MKYSLLALLAQPFVALSVQAANGDIAAGYDFAMGHCAACHVVAPNQDPPRALAVPSFFHISRSAAGTELGLRAFLRTEHDRMPNFILRRDEEDNVIAYILSLKAQPRPKPRLPKQPEPRKDIANPEL